MKRRGFTLVELMVVMVLTVIILALLGALYQQFFRTVESVTETTDAYDEIRSVNQMLTREMGATLCRKNTGRWLNFKVEEDRDGIFIYFTAPEEALNSTLEMSYITHYAWYYRKAHHALYRVAYNTQQFPEDLLKTASSVNNDNNRANADRLGNMTLAYQHGTPYGWTRDTRFTDLLDQPAYKAMIKRVYHFEVRCYKEPAGTPGPTPVSSWDDPGSLPMHVELVIGIAKGGVVKRAEHEWKTYGELREAKTQLNTFVLSVPMRNHGVYDNEKY